MVFCYVDVVQRRRKFIAVIWCQHKLSLIQIGPGLNLNVENLFFNNLCPGANPESFAGGSA